MRGERVFSELVNHRIRESLCSTGMLNQFAEHGSEANEDTDVAEGAAEATHDDVVELACGDPRGDCGQYRYEDKRDESVQLKFDDEHEDEQDTCGGDAEERTC